MKTSFVVQDNAETAVKDLLKSVAKSDSKVNLHAIDYMDDGSRINLRVEIDGMKVAVKYHLKCKKTCVLFRGKQSLISLEQLNKYGTIGTAHVLSLIQQLSIVFEL